MGDVLRWVFWIAVAWVGWRFLVRVQQMGTYHRHVDRRRWFSKSEYHQIMRRAGYRCEHYFWPFGRCNATMPLESDHVHPWAKGGQTSVENGQALCHSHNQIKGAWPPTAWQVWRLERRRAEYFPSGEDPSVTRYGPEDAYKRRGRDRKRGRTRRRRRW